VARDKDRDQIITYIPKRTYTEKGRVVYKRKKHKFSIKDAERIMASLKPRSADLSNWELILKYALELIQRAWKYITTIINIIKGHGISDLEEFFNAIMDYAWNIFNDTDTEQELNKRFREWVRSWFGFEEPKKG